ncbi:MAG: hypothetical protein L3V56_03635 [Candidatus Magnetoovum sp. WYHC-5]|nr:hypothetical protein [Candidatus Magnetoovum sp. WYHC-5]
MNNCITCKHGTQRKDPFVYYCAVEKIHFEEWTMADCYSYTEGCDE